MSYAEMAMGTKPRACAVSPAASACITRLKSRVAASSGVIVLRSGGVPAAAGPVIGGAAGGAGSESIIRGPTLATTRARRAAPAMNQGRFRLAPVPPAAAGVPGTTGVPHMLQKRPPRGIGLPQPVHRRVSSRDPPHCEQNFPVSFVLPQPGQVFGIQQAPSVEVAAECRTGRAPPQAVVTRSGRLTSQAGRRWSGEGWVQDRRFRGIPGRLRVFRGGMRSASGGRSTRTIEIEMNAAFRVGVVQRAVGVDKEATLAGHEASIRQAAERGAQVICLQELFDAPYFCKVT